MHRTFSRHELYGASGCFAASVVVSRMCTGINRPRANIHNDRTNDHTKFYIYDIFFGELEMSNTVHTLIYTFTSLEYFIIELDLNI